MSFACPATAAPGDYSRRVYFRLKRQLRLQGRTTTGRCYWTPQEPDARARGCLGSTCAVKASTPAAGRTRVVVSDGPALIRWYVQLAGSADPITVDIEQGNRIMPPAGSASINQVDSPQSVSPRAIAPR